jgi:hypothetical protein
MVGNDANRQLQANPTTRRRSRRHPKIADASVSLTGSGSAT